MPENGPSRRFPTPPPRRQGEGATRANPPAVAERGKPRAPTPDDDQWTTRKLIRWMADRFAQNGIDSPRLCAELLLSHVLGCDRIRLYTEADRPASPLERQTLRDLVTRALAHEPVQ